MNDSPLLQCTEVRKAFPKPDGAELLVLEGMNLELREGQIVGLLGRSGSGKSRACSKSDLTRCHRPEFKRTVPYKATRGRVAIRD